MPIFSKIRNFLYRNRTKFMVGGVLITSSVLLMRYAQQKLREWQEKEAREFFERTRRQQHFESTERTCNQTILNLMATLNEALRTVNTEDVVEELRKKPENKLDLWEKLKILVFVRASCLIYLTPMLVILLRIQLNIIGGYLFKSPTSISTDLQQKYLSLAQRLFTECLDKLTKLTEKECTKIVDQLDLKKQLKLTDLENIFYSIQTAITTNDENPINKIKEYIIDEEIEESGTYSQMIRDTADLLESDEVKSLATHCINRGFILLNDQIAEFYVPNGGQVKDSASSSSTFVHPSDIAMPLAKLIPVINGLFARKLPYGLVQQLLANERIKTLGANVYECFSNSK